MLGRNAGWLGVIVAMLLVGGCGGGPHVKLVPVEGTVKLNGKPLANKSLMFTPESGSGVSAGANTDANGNYKLIATIAGATTDQVGVPPGKYKVTVFEPMIEIQGKADGAAPAGEAMLIPGQGKSDIPKVYQANETTPLKVDVTEAGGKHDLELKS